MVDVPCRLKWGKLEFAWLGVTKLELMLHGASVCRDHPFAMGHCDV